MKTFCVATVLLALIGCISAQCLQCSSNVDGECINPDGNKLSKACPAPGCYSRVTGGHTVRGCSSDLEQSARDACIDEADCRLCNSTNCNGGLFPSHRIFCHYCEPLGDQNCTEAITGIATPCKYYVKDDKCIVRKVSDGRVRRECLSDYEDCSKETTCKQCDSHGCNNFEYNTAITLSIHNTIFFTGLAYFLSKLF